MYCFLEGTEVSTPKGPVKIEDLAPGDDVLTHDNRSVPGKWVGRQTVRTRFRMPDRVRPVRIAVGALGEGTPVRDLYVTPDHALFMDGYLINASALVTGTSIRYAPLSQFGESYVVYHIETEDHEVSVAEGVFAETFIDYGTRSAFDNYAEYDVPDGGGHALQELPYPRLAAARLVPDGIRRRLGLYAVA